MNERILRGTGAAIAPLVVGGNVFGWTVDQSTSFKLLDRMLDAGLNAIDTADVYSKWAPGNHGGESETIIGKWLHAVPSRREQVVLITKVGSEMAPGKKGLGAAYIQAAVEDSLRRLQTEYIDLYLSHYADPDTPIEETLAAFDKLIRQGKVRAIGSSNYDVAELRAALLAAERYQLPRYTVHQPEYNLYDRAGFEAGLRELCVQQELSVITYYSLASGFLSGKYRSAGDLQQSPRGTRVAKYLDARGLRILAALDAVAAEHDAAPAEVALAWLMAAPGVTAPIASATSLAQMDSLIRATRLALTAADNQMLDLASRYGD